MSPKTKTKKTIPTGLAGIAIVTVSMKTLLIARELVEMAMASGMPEHQLAEITEAFDELTKAVNA